MCVLARLRRSYVRTVIITGFVSQCLALLSLQVEHAAEMAGVLSDPDLYAFTGVNR